MGITHFHLKTMLGRVFQNLTEAQLQKGLLAWENVGNGTTGKAYNVKYVTAEHKHIFRYCKTYPADKDLIVANPMFDDFAAAAVNNLLFAKGEVILRDSVVIYVSAIGRLRRALGNKCPYALREQLRDVGALGDEAGTHQYATMVDAVFGGRAKQSNDGEIVYDSSNLDENDVRLKNAAAINNKLQKSISNAPYLRNVEATPATQQVQPEVAITQEALRSSSCEHCGIAITKGAYVHKTTSRTTCGACSRKRKLNGDKKNYYYLRMK